jgi:hypothetical protein
MPRRLAECKNLQDLYRVYAQFFQNACSQYQSRLQLMLKLSQSISETAVQSLQSRSDEATQTKH